MVLLEFWIMHIKMGHKRAILYFVFLHWNSSIDIMFKLKESRQIYSSSTRVHLLCRYTQGWNIKKNRTSFSLWVLHKLSLVCEIVIVIARQIHYYVQSIVLCKRHLRTLNYLIIVRVHSLILWQFSLNVKST